MVEVIELVHTMKEDPKVMKLMKAMLTGNITEAKPGLDLSSNSGFSYPSIESSLGMTTEEITTAMELLSSEEILERQFHDKLFLCPYCHSPNLRPSLRCPKCSSGDIAKGRVLEHFSCTHIGLEDEYMAAGKYLCPKCKKELKFLGTDYRSLGVNYKCHGCGEVFSEASLKWQCLKCLVSFSEGEAKEIILYSYRVNEERRAELAFELGPKTSFIELLRNQGYTVTEQAHVNTVSKSGAEHIIDIFAQRDDGFITYTIGIGVAVNTEDNKIGLEEVFRFDDKAYDLGIHDKVLLVMPCLSAEARQFAQRQRIKLFEGNELEVFLSSASLSSPRQVKNEPFEFENKAQLVEHLIKLGHKVQENTRIQGRSGAEHTLDILTYNDDGFITHTLGIGIISAEAEVNLDAVSSFDTKAYDTSIHDKVLLVSPKLSQEAKQFALQQKIKVIEVKDSAKLM